MMLSSGIIALLLVPFVLVLALSLVYILSFCYLTKHRGVVVAAAGQGEAAENSIREMGLTAAQLEKLPRIRGEGLVLGNDCAVCLDEIESDQMARMVPGCNHAFHVQCADAWLSRNSVCPLCRSKIGPELLDPPENSPC